MASAEFRETAVEQAMPSFSPARDQDAWATIRGFRYQIDLTLLRWLSLADGQQLQLECGEDIDLLARAVNEQDESEYYRKLEQVKVRQGRVTLRSQCVLEFLVNAFDHRAANPTLDLCFLFTSNAEVGIERPNPFPKAAAGIKLWRQVGSRVLDAPEQAAAVAAIQEFFSLVSRPKRVCEERWHAFQGFMQTAQEGEAVAFISQFEFNCGLIAAEEAATGVQRGIRERLGSADEPQVTETYDRLVVFVLSLLAQPGDKRLHSALLAEQLQLPTLTAADRESIQLIRQRLAGVESRVGQVEEAVSQMTQRIDGISATVDTRIAAIGSIPIVTLAPPPLVTRRSPRTATIERLAAESEHHRWIALFGGSDTGKTQLAAMLANDFSQAWFRFSHNMQPSQAVSVFMETLRRLSDQPADRVEMDLSESIRSLVRQSSIVVLDDLPQLDGAHPILNPLIELAAACSDQQTKVISTSHFRLPMCFLELSPADCVLETTAPPLTDDEVNDVLRAYDAPDAVVSSGSPRFINGLCSGHPLLVALAAQFLAQTDWELDDDALDALLRGDHAAGLGDEILRRIGATLDPDQRDFLYRIGLSSLAIEDVTAIRLANLVPPISRPKEQLVSLIGAWVQRPMANHVAVSPLARRVAAENLDATTLQQCHLVLGESIAASPMGPWDAHIAIGHFVQADAFDTAGVLLLMLLNEFRCRHLPQDGSAALAPWADLPTPDGMKLSIRLMIRAMQFWVFPRFGRSDQFALRELDALMVQATVAEAPEAYHVAALAALFLSERDFPRALQYFNLAIPLLRESQVDRRQLVLPRRRKPVEILWNGITNIGTPENLYRWKSAFDQLTAEEQQIVIQSSDSQLGCAVLANHLVLVEEDKPAERRDWDAVRRAVVDLQTWADERQWEHLHACALQAEIDLQGNIRSDLEGCNEKVQQFLSRDDVSEEGKGRVSSAYGKVLAAMKGRQAEALPWLDRAIDAPPQHKGHNWIMTLMAAVKCTPDLGRRRTLAEMAADVARSDRSLPRIELAKVLGELAIAMLAGEENQPAALRAYPAWSEFADILLGHRQDDDEWKSLFVLFGHAQNYFVFLARGEEPPRVSSDGSLYAAPYQGMFYTTHPERASLFRTENVCGVMWYHSLYARAASDDTASSVWLQRVQDELENLPESHLTAFIFQEFLPRLLNADDYALAVDRGRRSVEVTLALREAYDRQGSNKAAIPYSTSVDELVDCLSEQGAMNVDRFSVNQVYLPAMLRIARVALHDRAAALEAATQMNRLCQYYATDAHDAEYHLGASRIFEAVADEANIRQIVELASSFDEQEQQPLRILGYLAVSTGQSPPDAFGSQLASIQVLWGWHPPESPVHRELLLPFIQEYWTQAFANQRFLFRAPAVVEPALEAAQAAPEPTRTLAVLRAVQSGFSIRGLEISARWLDSELAKADAAEPPPVEQ